MKNNSTSSNANQNQQANHIFSLDEDEAAEDIQQRIQTVRAQCLCRFNPMDTQQNDASTQQTQQRNEASHSPSTSPSPSSSSSSSTSSATTSNNHSHKFPFILDLRDNALDQPTLCELDQLQSLIPSSSPSSSLQWIGLLPAHELSSLDYLLSAIVPLTPPFTTTEHTRPFWTCTTQSTQTQTHIMAPLLWLHTAIRILATPKFQEALTALEKQQQQQQHLKTVKTIPLQQIQSWKLGVNSIQSTLLLHSLMLHELQVSTEDNKSSSSAATSNPGSTSTASSTGQKPNPSSRPWMHLKSYILWGDSS